jgi:hypothetical protein
MVAVDSAGSQQAALDKTENSDLPMPVGAGNSGTHMMLSSIEAALGLEPGHGLQAMSSSGGIPAWV